MNRRELIKMIAIATGGTMIGAEFFVAGCKSPNAGAGETFTKEDIDFLNEVANTILPPTKTPGAKEAGVGEFMTVMVNDCYTNEQQQIFKKGMGLLNDACEKMHSTNFMKASPEQRTALLIALDNEAKKYQSEKSEKDKAAKEKDNEAKALPDHYFTMMKQLSIFSFFTSKTGVEKALHYEPVPGKYIGVTEYKKGDKMIVGLNA